MTNTFLIADTHLGHRNIWAKFEAEARPFSSQEEHDEAIVERWNSVVGRRDIVWHLGDLLMGRQSQHLAAALNGRKRLLLGNHDSLSAEEYLELGFEVRGPMSLAGLLLTHFPIHPSCLEFRFKVNVHGHTHSRDVAIDGEIMALRQTTRVNNGAASVVEIPDPRYVNVSAEKLDLTPVPLETVRAWVRERGL